MQAGSSRLKEDAAAPGATAPRVGPRPYRGASTRACYAVKPLVTMSSRPGPVPTQVTGSPVTCSTFRTNA